MGRGHDFTAQRAAMVERQLRRRGIDDERVLAAMGEVQRELFVPLGQRRRAYRDGALPIGFGQTISQPWIVAAIAQALELTGGERVLEIGTGSGYSAAVIERLASMVLTVERIPELAAAARDLLAEAGAGRVEVVVADGSVGLPERGPYDGIAVHATAPAAPDALLAQLRPGGLLVIPIAELGADVLTAYRRTEGPLDPAAGMGVEGQAIAPCRFVPLIGRHGYAE